MQLDENKVTEIFFILDEFSKDFHKTAKNIPLVTENATATSLTG